MELMHRECAEKSDGIRRSAVDTHNKRTGVKSINFTTGDFVFKGSPSSTASKINLRSIGPYKVVKCVNNYIFEIKNLKNGKTELAHRRRLKYVRNSDFNVTEEIREFLEYQEGELLMVDSFEDVRK